MDISPRLDAGLLGRKPIPAAQPAKASGPLVGRLLRAAFALLVVGTTAYFIHDRFFVTASEVAVMAGRSVVLRAPIDGQVAMPPWNHGQHFILDSPIGSILNERADNQRLSADSDEGGHQFQSHRGHHSDLMAARPDHPRRSILLMSWSGDRGQAEARSLRRLSPLSSMRWAAWTTRSRTASARVGSPTISYQRPIGTWLVIISEPVL